MPNSHYAVASAFVALSVTLAMIGCYAPSGDSMNKLNLNEPTGVQIHISGAADVASVDLTVRRVSCSGESIEPFVVVHRVPVAKEGDTLYDVFIELDPGCYDIVAQPLTTEGIPSNECIATVIDNVVILKNSTTETGISFQCLGKPIGAIDAYAKLAADVVGAQFTLERVPCGNETVEPQSFIETAWASNDQYANAFFLATPGCFDMRIDPLEADGTHSDVCQPTTFVGVIVVDGFTSEIGADFICQ
jgi:hypothetical protein